MSDTTRLPDGTIGYCVRAPRRDDCFAASLATMLQVPIDEVPDPRIDERLAAGEAPAEIDSSFADELTRWLRARRLEMVVHTTPPTDADRWIGIVPMPGQFTDHCLVMARDELLFDPTVFKLRAAGNYRTPNMPGAVPFTIPGGGIFTRYRLRYWTAGDVKHGLTFVST